MKKHSFLAITAMLGLSLSLSFCTRKDDTKPTNEESVQVQDGYDSQTESDYATDAALKTVQNSSLSGATITGGRGLADTVCGASVDISQISSKKITITFNGNNCADNKSRTGQIVVQLSQANRWAEANAMLTLTFNNFKITRLSDNKSLTFNGQHKIVNVSGNVIGNASPSRTIIHKVRANMQVIFTNGAIRSWQAARRISYQGMATGGFKVTLAGDTTIESNPKTVSWGKTRFDRDFLTTFDNDLVVNSVCGWNKPVAGVQSHKKTVKDLKVTFGVDMAGNPVTNGCAYGYKINWTDANNAAKQAVVNY